MGHRANYAIRRGGVVELFYSHWGALTVPSDMFWGLSSAEAFVRSHRPADPNQDWLDDVWGEGGVALNYDDCVVTLFGGEALGHPPLRSTVLKLMRALWGRDGWSVEWADGMPAIAAAVGCDPSLATAEPVPPFPADLATLGDSFDSDDPFAGTLLTIVDGGTLVHQVSDADVVRTLYIGPDLIDSIDQLPDIDRVVEVWEPPDYRDEFWTLGDELCHSAIIDVTNRTIAWRNDFAQVSSQQFLSEKWEGWTVEKFEGPIDAHFDRLGQVLPDVLIPRVREVSDPSEVDLSEDEALARVAHLLIASERKDPAEFVRQLREDFGDSTAWINPDAAKSPGTVELSPEQKQQLFGTAIAMME